MFAKKRKDGKFITQQIYKRMRHQLPTHHFRETMATAWRRRTFFIAAFAIAGIVAHLVLRFGFHADAQTSRLPLLLTLILGGAPLVFELFKKATRMAIANALRAAFPPREISDF